MVKSKFYNLDTDETLASNSDYYIPSQKATKAYIDNISSTQTNTISDCILEIPQNIKLTLENNVLTLKAGSILTRTGSTYATVITTADKTYEISSSLADGKYIIFCTNTGAMHNPRILSKVSSGDSNSFPTDNLDGFSIYYNTDDKKIYSYNTSTLTWNEWTQIYPICLIEMNTGVASFAKDDNGYDIIFNSMCFMGKHAIAYPKIKGLIADGLNEDGTLKSKLYINSALQIIEIGNVNGYIISQNPLNVNLSRTGSIIEVETLDDIDLSIMNWTRYYVKSLNKYYVHFSANLTTYEHLTIASFKADSNGIYNITVRQPVRLATTEITDKINADLSNVVHKSGTESITGQKTFTSDLVLERSSVQPILRSTSYEKATAPASDTYMCHRRYLDKNNKSVFSEYYYIPRNTNKPSYILRFYNVSTSDATGYKDVIVANYDGTNSIYAIGATTATGPHPAATNSTTSNNLTTVAWVNNPDTSTNVVHRTGDETITGAKTFSNEVKMTAGGTSDISNGIVNSFKTNYAQATNFFTRNIIAGNNTSGSTASTLPITFQKYGSITSQHPSDLSDLMRINLDGSIQTYGSYPHREGKIEGYDLTNPTVDFELGYQWIDNNGKFAGGLRYGVNSVGRKTLDLRFKKRDQNNISIGISEDADGTTYTFAPTPIRDNTSSTEIDTVGARNTKLQSYVPNTRTINDKALSSNITLNASDVSALSSSTTINDLTTTAQQNALNSGITSSLVTQIGTNQTDISTINGKIPSAATTSNQLADKSFVNSSISTNTAYFIGTFNSVADLEAYSGTLTNNDYAFVISTDSAGNTVYNRYKYTTATNPSSWQFEYALNNSSFTSDQWAAINSGATPTIINSIANKADDNAVVKLAGDQTITGIKTYTSPQIFNKGYNAIILANPSNNTYSDLSGYKNDLTTRLGVIRFLEEGDGGRLGLTASLGSTLGTGIVLTKTSSGETATVIQPTEDTTSSSQIDTVGARNTKLANYALDNTVVKLTGDQTVTGVKTFNSAIKLRNNVPNSLTATADGEQALTSITTNSDGVIDGASIVRVVKYNANGENRRFVAYRAGFRKADDSGNNWPGIFVGVDTDGKTFGQFDTNKAFAPTPSTTTSTSDTYIATTGWTNTRLTNYSLDTSVVHITGNETITGSKIFSSEIVNTNSADAFTSKDTNITRGTTPSTSRSDFITRIVGNNGTTLAGVLYRHYTANNNEFSLIAYDPTQSTGYTGDVISIGYNSSGNIYTKAPTPTTTTSTSDVNIATTGWVNTVGNNIVHLTGDETISGSKTFNNTIYRAGDVTSAGGGGIVSYRLADTNTTSSGYIYNIMYYVSNQVINRHMSRNSISDKDIYLDIISRDNGTGRISLGGSVTSFDNLNNVDSSTTTTALATMGWVNNPLTSTNVVHRSGNETIAGVKTFSDNMNANGTITVGQHATMQYNSTTEALEFVFA